MGTDRGREPRESSLASGWTVEGQPVAQPQEASHLDITGEGQPELADTEAPAQLSSGALVLLGLVGGIYLLYTVVWFSWANAKSYENSLVADNSGSLGSVLQQIIFWAAPFAPALWFMSVLVWFRDSKLGKKLVWLAVGIIVLVPLPMLGGLI